MSSVSSPRALGVAFVLTLVGCNSSEAHDYSAAGIKVVHPWTRATPPGAKVGGGYLKIENSGAMSDRLLGGTSTVADRVEVHETSLTDGVARMRPVEGGLQIPISGKAELRPGGVHLMFLDLKAPLKLGERVKATLMFERAGAVEVEFQVDTIGAQPPAASEHGGH